MSRLRRAIGGLVTVGISVVGLSAPLLAQGEGEFRTVQPGDIVTEHLPATPLVFAAYAAVWIALLVYVIVLWRRLVRVEQELADVTRKLESRSS